MNTRSIWQRATAAVVAELGPDARRDRVRFAAAVALAFAMLAACEREDCDACDVEPAPCEWQAAIVDCAAERCPNASAAGVAPCVEVCIADIDCAPVSPLDRAYEREGAIAEISGDGDAWCGWRETDGGS